MELAKARKLTLVELTKEIAKAQSDVVHLRAEVAMHRIKNIQVLAAAKRYLARLLTIQREQTIIKSIN